MGGLRTSTIEIYYVVLLSLIFEVPQITRIKVPLVTTDTMMAKIYLYVTTSLIQSATIANESRKSEA